MEREKILFYKMFAERYIHRKKIESDLFNYATKSDLKEVTGIDPSKFSK